MSKLPDDLRAKLEDRVREQIASEVRGDVPALYEFTLPSIRLSRVAERDDEPELSLSEINAFVGLIQNAELESFEVEQFHPSVERFASCPAAVVVTRVRYNGLGEPAQFRCIWVYSGGNWFSTALGKIWFGPQRDNTKDAAEPGAGPDPTA